jgi:ferrous iron transport protein A
MPLIFVNENEEKIIKEVKGKDKQFLERLGFVVGTKIIIISKNSGNVIVKVKDSKIAISKEAAIKILV